MTDEENGKSSSVVCTVSDKWVDCVLWILTFLITTVWVIYIVNPFISGVVSNFECSQVIYQVKTMEDKEEEEEMYGMMITALSWCEVKMEEKYGTVITEEDIVAVKEKQAFVYETFLLKEGGRKKKLNTFL